LAHAPTDAVVTEQAGGTSLSPAASRIVTSRGSWLPFGVRRPFLILRDLSANRDRPNLRMLDRIGDPEAFVWAILPHAARTFSACIAMLPARSARSAAVAYLYCRMLDTYEDLVPDREAREASLRTFAARLDEDTTSRPLLPAPVIAGASDRDDRDRAHLLLVRRAHLVDQVFLSLDAPTRRVVRDLVRDMADGMVWSSQAFHSGAGVLDGETQVATYCRHVLGNPVVFSLRLMRMSHGRPPELLPHEREDAMLVGEMVQLANITRDVEKDLRRGIAYDASLRADLGRDPVRENDPALLERCRAARERLLRMALRRAPAYARIIDALRLPRRSVARGSAVLMLLFTERYFRGCARRVGMRSWSGPYAAARLMTRTAVATFSGKRAFDEIGRVERRFLAAAAGD
jgi:phytoene/squalene synthetase